MSEKIELRHSRGYLPHFDADGFTQFVTFRLAGSLPRSIFKELDFKRQNRLIDDREYFRQVEIALDVGHGPTYLREAVVGKIVADAVVALGLSHYELYAWVVMLNHVHLLFKPHKGKTLSAIMHSLKGYTATEANKALGRAGRFWSPDYFDRFIRDRNHFASVIRYIENNPVKAGLCGAPYEWPWSSAAA